VTDEVFNIASGVETSLDQLARTPVRRPGSHSSLNTVPRKVTMSERRLVPTSKARDLLASKRPSLWRKDSAIWSPGGGAEMSSGRTGRNILQRSLNRDCEDHPDQSLKPIGLFQV